MADRNPEETVKRGTVDSHCHLFLLDEALSSALAAARAAGVDTFVCPGIDVETSRRGLELAHAEPGVFATAGVHPHAASEFDARAVEAIRGLLEDGSVVAVGECGLDFYRMKSPREDQERAFKAQLALASEAGAPLVVHTRDAWPEILRLLDEGSAERVVLHCFSGDAEIARECAARGYHLSFAGNITYPRNSSLREAAAAVPLERILAETDSPFLAPQRLRGRDNQPANILDVIEEVARARGEAFDLVRRATSANARTAFPSLPTPPKDAGGVRR